MRQHDKERNDGTDGGCKPCAVNPHVTGEYEVVITENVENAAGQHAKRRQSGMLVVAQKRRQHLVEQEEREHIPDRAQICLRQHKQGFVCPEEGQNRALKSDHAGPREYGQNDGANHRRGKILIFDSVTCFAAALRAEDDAAANPNQQPQTVNDVPNRRDDRQRRRSLRPVVLPDHRRVNDRIDRRNQRTAKRRR